MADLSWWTGIDPTDWKTMWQRTIGCDDENPEITARDAAVVLDGIPPGDRVLEIGSGVGRLLKPMCDRFRIAIGVDVSPILVEMSREYLRKCPRAYVEYGNGYTLAFPEEWFDFVFSVVVFHHMPTLEMVQSNLKEAYRVLRPGGLCRIQTIPRVNDGYPFPDRYAFTAEFLRAGFDIISAEEGLIHPSHLWITARKP